MEGRNARWVLMVLVLGICWWSSRPPTEKTTHRGRSPSALKRSSFLQRLPTPAASSVVDQRRRASEARHYFVEDEPMTYATPSTSNDKATG